MDIENKIFTKSKIDYDKLKMYGFINKNNKYIFNKNILDDSMMVTIIISDNNNIDGCIIDLATGLEYTNYRLDGISGEFVAKVREEYENILKDIRDKCTNQVLFHDEQSNRITKKIYEKYGVKPEFLWKDYPDFGIFRNIRSNKWFALIMNIDKSKLIKKASDNVDVINIKLDDEVSEYIKKVGIYPAYHMNKNKWVTIILDDTLNDEYIIELIDKSYKLNSISGIWVVPANPKYYDIANAFNGKNELIWKQSNNILKDDIVYIYVTNPYSCLMYKCIVLESSIPYEYKSKNLKISYVMRLKLLSKYKNDEYPLTLLEKYGLKSVRGPRSMPQELLDLLNKNI